DQSADKLAEYDADENDHDRCDYAGDVADQLPKDARERFQSQRVRSYEDDGEHHQPEHEIAYHARRVEERARSLDRAHLSAALQHCVQSNTAQEPLDDALEDFREQISREDDDERTEQRRNQIAEHFAEAGLQAVRE